jgi:hypothetical protein
MQTLRPGIPGKRSHDYIRPAATLKSRHHRQFLPARRLEGM